MYESSKIYIFESGKLTSLCFDANKEIAYGCEAFYFPISSQRGLKVFSEKNNALRSFERQSRAYKAGIAPQVRSNSVFKVIFPVGFDKNIKRQNTKKSFNFFVRAAVWGFFTEPVTVFKNEYVLIILQMIPILGIWVEIKKGSWF
jgi:hypothetical protein